MRKVLVGVFQGSVAISLVVGLDSNRRGFFKTEYKHKKTMTILFYIFAVCESGAERSERISRVNDDSVEMFV